MPSIVTLKRFTTCLTLWLLATIFLYACSDTPETPPIITGTLTPTTTAATALQSPPPATQISSQSSPTTRPAEPTQSPVPTQTAAPPPIVIVTPEPPGTPTSPPPPPLPTDTPVIQPTPSPVTSWTATVNDDNVNFRTGPGFQYPSLGKYSRGTPLTVFGKDSSGAWLQVSISDGPTGWMMTQYINLTTDISAFPLATAQPAPTSPTPPVLDATVDDSNVNLRTGPGFEYPSQGQYSRGTPIKVLGRHQDGEWVKVTVAGSKTGWMMTQYISLKTDLFSVPIAEAPPAPPRPATTSPIRVNLASKDFQYSDYSAGIYNDYIILDFDYTNRTGKKVRAFTGVLYFEDLFGRSVYSGQLTYEDGIAVGGTVRERRNLRYNQFIDSHVRLRTIKQKDLITIFLIEEIILSDGSRLSYP